MYSAFFTLYFLNSNELMIDTLLIKARCLTSVCEFLRFFGFVFPAFFSVD